MLESLRLKIKDTFPSCKIEIFDESSKHYGHLGVGDRSSKISHLKIVLISDLFIGMSRIDRQKTLHKLLECEIRSLHSVTFRIYTLDEVSHETRDSVYKIRTPI